MLLCLLLHHRLFPIPKLALRFRCKCTYPGVPTFFSRYSDIPFFRDSILVYYLIRAKKPLFRNTGCMTAKPV